MNRIDLSHYLEEMRATLKRNPICSGYCDSDDYIQGSVSVLNETIGDTIAAIEDSYDLDKEPYSVDPMDLRKAMLEMEDE
jgi:hypothetical protein